VDETLNSIHLVPCFFLFSFFIHLAVDFSFEMMALKNFWLGFFKNSEYTMEGNTQI